MKRYAVAIAFALSASGATSAFAADATVNLPEQPTPDIVADPSRALQITPYMWATGLEGRLSPFRRAPTISVDKSFSDVIDDLNFGGFVKIWGRYERFVFSGDLMYVNTTDNEASGPLPALQIPGIGVIPPGAVIDARVDTRQLTATLQGGYRIVDTPKFTFDALGGVRFWHISNDVTVAASHPAIGSVSATHAESFSWVDPVIGARVFIPVTEKLSVQAQADIGGFGAGSDMMWSAMATVNYVLSDHLSASVGYKVLDVDYDRGGHVFDARMSGPVLGLTYRF